MGERTGWPHSREETELVPILSFHPRRGFQLGTQRKSGVWKLSELKPASLAPAKAPFSSPLGYIRCSEISPWTVTWGQSGQPVGEPQPVPQQHGTGASSHRLGSWDVPFQSWFCLSHLGTAGFPGQEGLIQTQLVYHAARGHSSAALGSCRGCEGAHQFWSLRATKAPEAPQFKSPGAARGEK